MVFEAARRGICPVVTRRLHDSEKTSLVVSGSVFAFDEHATGIKRCALSLRSTEAVQPDDQTDALAFPHRDGWNAMEPFPHHRQLPRL